MIFGVVGGGKMDRAGHSRYNAGLFDLFVLNCPAVLFTDLEPRNGSFCAMQQVSAL